VFEGKGKLPDDDKELIYADDENERKTWGLKIDLDAQLDLKSTNNYNALD
jgi:hypothetical protein